MTRKRLSKYSLIKNFFAEYIASESWSLSFWKITYANVFVFGKIWTPCENFIIYNLYFGKKRTVLPLLWSPKNLRCSSKKLLLCGPNKIYFFVFEKQILYFGYLKLRTGYFCWFSKPYCKWEVMMIKVEKVFTTRSDRWSLQCTTGVHTFNECVITF